MVQTAAGVAVAQAGTVFTTLSLTEVFTTREVVRRHLIMMPDATTTKQV